MDVTKVQNEMIKEQCMEWVAMFQGKILFKYGIFASINTDLTLRMVLLFT